MQIEGKSLQEILAYIIRELRKRGGGTGPGGPETDPVFSASPAASITNANKTLWSDKNYDNLTNKPDLSLKANLVGGKVPASELPSYVDDVLEYPNSASFPTSGEIGKLYVATNNNQLYRWTGSVYVNITQAETLDTVTTRGNSTPNDITFNSGVTNAMIFPSQAEPTVTTTLYNPDSFDDLVVNLPSGNGTLALVEQVSPIYNVLATKADLVAGKVPAAQLPSYVDDVLEFADLASFPATGETGKIYVALNNNLIYRWSGSAYIEVSPTVDREDLSKFSNIREVTYTQDVTNYYIEGFFTVSAKDNFNNQNTFTGGVRLWLNGFEQVGTGITIVNANTGANPGWFSYFSTPTIYDPSSVLQVMGYTTKKFKITIPKATNTDLRFGSNDESNWITILIRETSFFFGPKIINVPYTLPTVFTIPKQDVLISGTNIKTFNGVSLLGSGNVVRKNEAGQVKVNYTGLSVSNFTANVFKIFDINAGTPTIVASPTTKYPNSTPNSYVGVFDSARGTSPTGRLIENPIQGQTHIFRVQGTFSGKNTLLADTQILYLRLRNPVSGFQIIKNIILAPNVASGTIDENFIVIADTASITSPNGYIIESAFSIGDSGLNITITSITRFSNAIEP